MAMKLVPCVQVLVQSLDAANVRVEPHGVCDALRDVPDLAVDGMQYWDLNDEVTGLRTCGYTLAPAIVPKNMVAPGVSQAATHNSDYGDLAFVPVCGRDVEPNDWAVVTPDYEPYSSALRWYNSEQSNNVFHAYSEGLPAGQDFAVQLHTHGYTRQATDGNAFWQIAWGGGRYAIQVQGGGQTVLCERVNGAWKTRRSLPVAAEDFGGDPMWLRVHHIAGRVVVDIEQGKNTQRTVYTKVQTQGNANDPLSGGTPKVIDATPPAGPVVIEGQGVPFSARVHEIQYAASGSLTREYRAGGSGAAASAAFGFNSVRPGTVATITHAVPDGDRGAYRADVARETTGTGVEAMEGHATPFVMCVAASWDGSVTSVEETWLDLSVATLAFSLESPDPRLGGGTKATVRLRSDLLPQCLVRTAGGAPAGVAGDAIDTYLERYHRAHVRISWQYDDYIGASPPEDGSVLSNTGVLNPADGTYHECAHAFDGYVWAIAPALPKFGEGVVEVTLRDGLCRFEKPAGLIDQRFVAGDVILATALQTSPRARLYGHQLVDYIARIVLGDDMTELVTAFPAGHYDLMRWRQLVEPSFQTGFFFPPPWGQSAADWIKMVSGIDFAVFFFGYGTDQSGYTPRWVPWYCDYYSVMSGQVPIRLPDSYYGFVPVADEDLSLSSVEGAQEPSRDYNRVLVWGKYPQDPGGYQDIMPALPAISAEAYVATSLPEQDPVATWERTLLIQNAGIWLPHVAEAVAYSMARLLEDFVPRRVTVKMRGEPMLWGGYKVWLDLQNSVMWTNDGYGHTLQVVPSGEDYPYRIMRLRHEIDLIAKTFFTTLSLAPEPNTL